MLAKLPEGVRYLLPMDFTHKGGMTWGLQRFLVAAAPTGSSITSLCDVRNELAVSAHVQEEFKYLHYLLTVAKSTGQSTLLAAWGGARPPLKVNPAILHGEACTSVTDAA